MEENEEPEWMTELDKEILEILTTGLTLSPSIIAENIDRSREGVSNRLKTLQAGGLVSKVARGKYELSEYGEEVFNIYGSPERFPDNIMEQSDEEP